MDMTACWEPSPNCLRPRPVSAVWCINNAMCMDYGLHDALVHATSWQGKQAMFIKMSFLTTDHRESDLGGSHLRGWVRTKVSCCCVVLLPMALTVALRRRKGMTIPRSRWSSS